MVVAEMGLDGRGLWFGEVMVDGPCKGALLTWTLATLMQPQAEAELGQRQPAVLNMLPLQNR